MTRSLFHRTGWYTIAALLLCVPLVQGGSPRLPVAASQSAILLLAAFWFLHWGWSSPCQSLRVTVLDGLLAGLLFLALFSFLFAPYQYSAGRALLALGVFSLLYWCLVFNGSRKGIDLVLWAVVVQGSLQSVLVWYRWGVQDVIRPSGTFYNPNFMAGFTAVAALVALGGVVFPAARGKGLRTVMAVAALLAVGAVFITQSRGGMLALLAGGLVLLAGRSLRLTAGLSGAGLAALFILPNPFIERLGTLHKMDVYAYSRLSMWKGALRMMLDHPWFGIGLGQYEYFSPRYAFPVHAHWAKYGRIAAKPHSELLHAGAELGLPGLLICLAMVLILLAALRPAVRKVAGRDRGVFFSLAAAMTALLVHSAVDFPLHIPPLALLFVAVAASLRILGVEGPSGIVEFRFRKVYGAVLTVMMLFLMFHAVRPVVAFTFFLEGLGAPKNLLAEKWALQEAPRREVPEEESIAAFQRAVALEPRNAAYHNALGSRYFQAFLRAEEDDEELKRKGLYHASFALELNPGNFRYAYSLGQAMEELYRRYGEGRFLSLAMEEYGRALDLSPEHYALHEKIAFLAEESGHVAAAEKGFRTVVALEPNYIQGWYNIGVFLARWGRVDEGREALARAQAIPAGIPAEASTSYEKTLLDFDMELIAQALAELPAAGEGSP